MKKEPDLVTIILITYNSSSYVVETLNSIKNQTYNNIELVLTDDCSTDNTVDICSDWIDSFADRFVRVKIITAKVNNGVSSNCNRGLFEAKGKWVKFIAGDDLLISSCISKNVNFANSHKEASFIFSHVQCISQDSIDIKDDEFLPHNNFFQLSSNEQFNLLIINNRVFAPTSFIKRDVAIELNGFDEEIRNIEDYPMWIKATSKGYKLFLLEEKTVKYRVYIGSISKGSRKKMKNDLAKLYYNYKLKNLNFRNFLYIWEDFLALKALNFKNEKLLRLLSPIYIYRSLR
jgi:glycosyltransferase involved in cell wall biosynthesis